MNQIAKTMPAPVASSRIPSGLRIVSSFDRPPIEEISPQVGANFDGTNFSFENERQGLGGERQRFSNTPGRFFAPSQTFASIFEVQDVSTEKGVRGGNTRHRDFAGLVAKAVQIYETNAKIIHGEQNVLGTSLNVHL